MAKPSTTNNLKSPPFLPAKPDGNFRRRQHPFTEAEGFDLVPFSSSSRFDYTRLLDEVACALHLAAASGIDPDVIGLLVWKVPGALNHPDGDGKTPLWYAADGGHESAVVRLLYAGATNENNGQELCPLSAAVLKGHEGVVRILIEEGVEAIGGFMTVSHSVDAAVKTRRTRILHALLTTSREEPGMPMKGLLSFSYWGRDLLYHAAAFGHLRGTSALLSAEMF